MDDYAVTFDQIMTILYDRGRVTDHTKELVCMAIESVVLPQDDFLAQD